MKNTVKIMKQLELTETLTIMALTETYLQVWNSRKRFYNYEAGLEAKA